MKKFNNYYNIFEARVTRTIDTKLWNSVSSGISKTYRNDMGASAKPKGTRDELLQRFIAALVILKQPCPVTINELENCDVFPQWAQKLVEMGITIEEVHKLWNENCGNLPKMDSTIINTSEPDDVIEIDNDDIIDDENEDDYIIVDNIDKIIPTNNVVNQAPRNNPSNSINRENNTNTQQPIKITPDSFKQVIGKLINNKHTDISLAGIRNIDEALLPLNQNVINEENIQDNDALDELYQTFTEQKIGYLMRVFGGSYNSVVGDIVWCQYKNAPGTYYIVAGNNSVKFFYREVRGELSLVYDADLSAFGLMK